MYCLFQIKSNYLRIQYPQYALHLTLAHGLYMLSLTQIFSGGYTLQFIKSLHSEKKTANQTQCKLNKISHSRQNKKGSEKGSNNN